MKRAKVSRLTDFCFFFFLLVFFEVWTWKLRTCFILASCRPHWLKEVVEGELERELKINTPWYWFQSNVFFLQSASISEWIWAAPTLSVFIYRQEEDWETKWGAGQKQSWVLQLTFFLCWHWLHKKRKKNEPADPEKVTVESNWDIISAQFLFRWLSVFANPLSFEICINNPSATMKGGINVSRIIEEMDFGIDVA